MKFLFCAFCAFLRLLDFPSSIIRVNPRSSAVEGFSRVCSRFLLAACRGPALREIFSSARSLRESAPPLLAACEYPLPSFDATLR